MKGFSLQNCIGGLLLTVLAGLIIHAPLTVWLVSNGAPVEVKAWKEMVLVGASALLVVSIVRSGRNGDFLRDPLIVLCALYGVLHLLLACISNGSIQSIASGLVIDLRYIVYFVVVYIFLQYYPRYRRGFVGVGVVCATIVAGFAMLQTVLPREVLTNIGYSDATIKPYLLLDDNPDFVRMNSTMRGPNPLGAYAMIVATGVIVYAISKRRLRTTNREKLAGGFLALGALVSLWISYSRSAWIGLAASGTVLLITIGRLRDRRLWIAMCTVIILCAGLLYGLRDTTLYKNIILHDNPSTGAVITSNQGHQASLHEGLNRLISQPFGAGIGSTGSASLQSDEPMIIENQYLMIAHESGWLGLGIFVAIWMTVLGRLWRRREDWLALALCASGVGLAVISLSWPVLTDDPVSMIWWGMAAVALIGKSRDRHVFKRTNRR